MAHSVTAAIPQATATIECVSYDGPPEYDHQRDVSFTARKSPFALDFRPPIIDAPLHGVSRFHLALGAVLSRIARVCVPQEHNGQQSAGSGSMDAHGGCTRMSKIPQRAMAAQQGAAPPLLEIERVTIRFGGIVALDGVTFSVATGRTNLAYHMGRTVVHHSKSRRPMVAVGTRIAPRPPHRSRRALLTHRAPPLGSGVEAMQRLRV
jgi:hypothetical protein